LRVTKQSGKNCVVVFPPVWEVAAPYLAGPSLAAWLRSRGLDAFLLDANLLFWSHFKNRGNAEAIHEICREQSSSIDLALEDALVGSSVARMEFGEFASWLDRSSLTSPAYKLLVRRFGGFWKPAPQDRFDTLDYHDGLFSDVSHSAAALNSGSLRDSLLDNRLNPWLGFAERHVMPKVEEAEPSLLGISIVAVNQVVPAFSIGVIARKMCPTLPIFFGGAWVTQLRERLKTVEWFRELGFVFVPFQGEAALSDAMSSILSGADTMDGFSGEHVREVGRQVPMNDLPSPDFSDLHLGAYGEPGHLPLMASRGCYWGKCKFCSYPILEPEFEVRNQKRLSKDIDRLVKAHGARHIAFVDPSISAPLARRIADTIFATGADVSWGGLARLEHRFTRDLLRHISFGGCRVMHWGLESGSRRVQDSICKGIELDTVRGVLEDAAAAGIHNRVLMMYGLPGETDADLEASLSFIEKNLAAMHSICWSHYAAEEGTPFGNDLITLDPSARSTTDLSVGVRLTSSLSPSFLRDAKAQMNLLSARIAVNSRQVLKRPALDTIVGPLAVQGTDLCSISSPPSGG